MRLSLGLLAALITTAGLTPAASAAPPESRPTYAYDQAIRETAWVETGTDHDRDGKVDRVAADVIRPRATVRVPVILDVSPYYACCGRGNESQKKTYAPDGTPQQFPLFLDNYFVPRGYAVVLADVGGTNRSSGCFDDVGSGNAVVNWLNGRAKAFDAPDGGRPVRAGWATGDVGAIGKSQDGATAIGMAASGHRGAEDRGADRGRRRQLRPARRERRSPGHAGEHRLGLHLQRARGRAVPAVRSGHQGARGHERRLQRLLAERELRAAARCARACSSRRASGTGS